MASFIIHGEMPERFRHQLTEAIDALGYYRTDALEQLLGMYRQHWPRGLSSTMFRLADIEHLLSEKGLADPHHAQAATTLRAEGNQRREEFDAKHVNGATGAIFCAPRNCVCDEAQRLDQSKVGRSGRWSLPLPSCRQEWCPCSWVLVFDLD